MSRIFVVALAAVALVACRQDGPGATQGTTGPGATGQQQERQQDQQQAAVSTVSGTVTDVGSDQIQVRTQAGQEIELSVGDGNVYVDGQPVPRDHLEDRIREGTQVRATYSVSGDDRILTRIDVEGGAGAQPGMGTGQGAGQGDGMGTGAGQGTGR